MVTVERRAAILRASENMPLQGTPEEIEELSNDKDFIRGAVRTYSYAFRFASDELKNDREFALELLRIPRPVMEDVSDELKNDGEFMLAAAEIYSYALSSASKELRNDREFMLKAAINGVYWNNNHPFGYASDELKNNGEFVFEIVRAEVGHLELEEAEKMKRNGQDPEPMLSATRMNRYSNMLSHMGEDLKNNREFMLQMAKEYRNTFEYASEELKNDREFVLEVIEHIPYGIHWIGNALIYAGKELRNDREFVLEVVKRRANNGAEFSKEVPADSDGLLIASDELKNDREFVLECEKWAPGTIYYASNALIQNNEFMEKCGEVSGIYVKKEQKQASPIDKQVLEALQDVEEAEGVLAGQESERTAKKEDDVVDSH